MEHHCERFHQLVPSVLHVCEMLFTKHNRPQWLCKVLSKIMTACIQPANVHRNNTQ